MTYQSVFQRHELKYLLTRTQQHRILDIMKHHMAPDQYGLTQIRNIYYDTDNFRLIRHSLDKPVYKEKLRIRSYNPCNDKDTVFVELKKKYDGIVYKRRLTMPYSEATAWLAGKHSNIPPSQIGREINYFLDFYQQLKPVVFLSYQRQAWYGLDGSDFRVTFDYDITARQDRLHLSEDCSGLSILADDYVLMELKTSSGIPLWMTNVLSENQIYKTSFSKYGTAYETTIFKGDTQYANSIV